MVDEEWENVVGFEDYFMVSNYGHVWSKRTNKFLIPVKNKAGYLTIPTKIGGRQGKAYCLRVHRMVAEAFISNPDEKPFINHIDCDKTNNHVSNLEWCTNEENEYHAYTNGLLSLGRKIKGSEVGTSKLTEEQIKEIRERKQQEKITQKELAKEYGVSRATIKDIIHYRYWKHV